MCRIVARPPIRSRIRPASACSRTAPWTKPITHQNAWPGPRRTIQVPRPHSVTRPNAPTIAEPATRCRTRTRALEVLARRALGLLGRLAGHLPRAELSAPHLLEGRLGLHVLGPQRRLDAVEETLQPPEELSLRHPHFRLAGRLVKRRHQRSQLALKVRREGILQLVHRGPVDLGQAVSPGIVELDAPNLLDQLPDHRSDPEELGGVRDDALTLALLSGDGFATGGDDLRLRLVAHGHSVLGLDGARRTLWRAPSPPRRPRRPPGSAPEAATPRPPRRSRSAARR